MLRLGELENLPLFTFDHNKTKRFEGENNVYSIHIEDSF